MTKCSTPKQLETILSENILGRIGCHDGLNTYVYQLIMCMMVNTFSAVQLPGLRYYQCGKVKECASR